MEPTPSAPVPTPGPDPFEQWRTELELRNLDFKTRSRYWQCAQAYRSWLDGRDPTPALAREFLASLRRRGYRPASIALYYHALRLAFDFCGQKLQVKLRRPQHLPPYWSRADVERTIAEAERGLPGQTEETRRRNAIALVVLADVGLRRSELLGLRVNDVDFNNTVVRIRDSKGQRSRSGPLTTRAAICLRDQCRGLGPQQRVFSGMNARNLYRMVVKTARAVGLQGFQPHALRHAYCTRLAELGVRMEVIQQLAGHQSTDTTRLYIGLLPQHLKEAVERLEGWPSAAAAAARRPA